MDNKETPGPPVKVVINHRRSVPAPPLADATGRELEEKIRVMRHDLRSSIGIIQNTLYLLEAETTGQVSERARRFIQVLMRQAGRMEEILEECREPRRRAAGTRG